MALIPGSSDKVVSRNISTEIDAGKPRNQAIATAMNKAGRTRKPKPKKKRRMGLLYS